MGQHTWCNKKIERTFEEATNSAIQNLRSDLSYLENFDKADYTDDITVDVIENDIVRLNTLLNLINEGKFDGESDYWGEEESVRDVIWSLQLFSGTYIEGKGYYVDCNEYHDVFRTNKRNSDGTYIDEIYFTSKEECDKWISENIEYVQHYGDGKYYNEFWEKYPDGMINFG